MSDAAHPCIMWIGWSRLSAVLAPAPEMTSIDHTTVDSSPDAAEIAGSLSGPTGRNSANFRLGFVTSRDNATSGCRYDSANSLGVTEPPSTCVARIPGAIPMGCDTVTDAYLLVNH
jgi:hypothetical protein